MLKMCSRPEVKYQEIMNYMIGNIAALYFFVCFVVVADMADFVGRMGVPV